MVSEQYLRVFKRQSEINKNFREISENGGRNFSNDELRFIKKLESELWSNHAYLIKSGPVDHAYFTKKAV